MAYTTLTHRQRAIVGQQRVIVFSLPGYCAQHGHDLAVEKARAIRFGHEQYALSLCASVICGDPGYYERDAAEWADAVRLAIGDQIVIDDSAVLTIGRAPNRNFSLIYAGGIR